jgi:hypothetical protein
VKRRSAPNELDTMEKTINPAVNIDLLCVRWRKNHKAQGAIVRMPRYFISPQNADTNTSREKAPTWETKTAKQRQIKDACNLSFLPVIINETAIIKLEAARVNVSISFYIVQNAKKDNEKLMLKFYIF